MPSGLYERRDVGLAEGFGGLADTLAAALRGSTKGTLGLVGDLSKNVKPTGHPLIDALTTLARRSDVTSEDFDKSLPKLNPRAGSDQFEQVQKLGEFVPSPAIAPAAAGKAIGRTAQELTTPAMAQALRKTAPAAEPLSIVRPSGGNFLKSSIADYYDADQQMFLHPAVTKFIDTKVKKYLQNEYGSRSDPLRPIGDAAEGTMAQRYAGNDNNYQLDNAFVEEQFMPDGDPWMQYHAYNAPDVKPNVWDMMTGEAVGTIHKPETARAVASALRGKSSHKDLSDEDLTHYNSLLGAKQDPRIIDELEQAAPYISERTPLSYLRSHQGRGQRIVPENYSTVRDMRKAIAEYADLAISDVNRGPGVAEWLRARKLDMTPADLEKASIKDILNKRLSYESWQNDLANPNAPINTAVKEATSGPWGKWMEFDPKSEHLAKGLRGEGTTQSHCVGDYCDHVQAGDSRIFTLRNPQGRIDLTAELQKNDEGKWNFNQVMGKANSPAEAKHDPQLRALIDHLNSTGDLDRRYLAQHSAEGLRKMMRRGGIDPDEAEAAAEAAANRAEVWLDQHPGQELPDNFDWN